MYKEDLKNRLIAKGVENLKIFGYPTVDSENILTDEVYSEIFKSMLIENKGASTIIDSAIDEILKQMPNG